MRAIIATAFLSLALSWAAIALYAQDTECTKCHARLTREKNIHAAISMGCSVCHTGLDAGKIPHKKTGNFPKGLLADQPGLCYECHDRSLFEKKNSHAAIGMGCTVCHNPHSSKNAKLLISEVPGLCMNCHDQAEFSAKNIHQPVSLGMCLGCHSPHASDNISLLIKKPVDLCLDCHPNIQTRPHAVVGFQAKGHPIGLAGDRKRELKDPSRPDRPFYCASCHNPHSADGPKLFRFKARSASALCINCHKK